MTYFVKYIELAVFPSLYRFKYFRNQQKVYKLDLTGLFQSEVLLPPTLVVAESSVVFNFA